MWVGRYPVQMTPDNLPTGLRKTGTKRLIKLAKTQCAGLHLCVLRVIGYEAARLVGGVPQGLH
jgi:hypothetical protein